MIRMVCRLLVQGVRDLRLNPWAQVLTLAAVTLVAFLSGLFLMALVTLNHQLGTVRGETVFQVYWRPGTAMSAIRGQWNDMRHVPGFTKLQTFTPEEALKNLGQRLGRSGRSLAADFPFLADQSPLPPTALVTFAPRDDNFDSWLEEVARYLRNLSGVERVAVTPLRDELGQAWREVSHYVMWPSIAFLCLVLALVVGNTIRLSLLARGPEVELLKLVGAFNWYIRLPLITGGAVLGAAGGSFALALLHLMHGRIRHVLDFPPLLMEIRFLPWELCLLLVFVPLLMGIAGSWIAVQE
jgi:cell division transport system permease protein